MKINVLAQLAVGIPVIPLVAAALLSPGATPARAAGADSDIATLYKAKCSMCHKANAEKSFDATKADDQLVQAILKGQKGEKPPFMPAYEAKGIDEAQAKALVAYMRSLRSE